MDLFFLANQFPRQQPGITSKADPTLLRRAANAIRVVLILPSSCVFRSVCWSWSGFSFGGWTSFVCFVWPSLDTGWTRDRAAAQNTQTSLVRGPVRGARKHSAVDHTAIRAALPCNLREFRECVQVSAAVTPASLCLSEGELQEDPPCCVFLQEVQIEMAGSQNLDSQPQGSV